MAEKGMRTAHQFAEAIVRKLEEQGNTVTFAESCTGGLVAATLVGVSGASHVFREGYLTYCDESKRDLLGVSQKTLDACTAVSHETAYEMAWGALRRSGADYAIAVTGYADGEEEFGGHRVIVACASKTRKDRVSCCERWYTGDRNTVRRKAAFQALKLLWEAINRHDEMV